MRLRSWICGALFVVLSGVPGRVSAAPPLSSGEQVLEELGKQVEDQSRPAVERLGIIRAFEGWGTEQVRPPLMAVLKDPLPEIRAAAAGALGWPGNRDAVPALRERVETPGETPAVRAAALRSLGRIGDRSVRALVASATQDPDVAVREVALWGVTLGSLADPSDRTSYLMQLAADRTLEGQLRAEAVRVLATEKEERVVETLVRILESEPRISIILPPGAPTPEQTMSLRYAQARDVAAWAAGALGQLGARATLPLLLRTAEDPTDYFLRLMSIRSLIVWSVPEAFPVFVRRLEDPIPDVRGLAVEAVARLGDPQGVEPVLGRLSDQIPAVRAVAVMALAVLGDSRVRPQIEALQLKEVDPDVRGAAEAALSRLGR